MLNLQDLSIYGAVFDAIEDRISVAATLAAFVTIAPAFQRAHVPVGN